MWLVLSFLGSGQVLIKWIKSALDDLHNKIQIISTKHSPSDTLGLYRGTLHWQFKPLGWIPVIKKKDMQFPSSGGTYTQSGDMVV